MCLVLGVEGDCIDQIGWAARHPRRDRGVALGNLAGLDECIGDVTNVPQLTVKPPCGETISELQTAANFGPVP